MQGLCLVLIGVAVALEHAGLADFKGPVDSPCTCHGLRSASTYFPLSERACIRLNRRRRQRKGALQVSISVTSFSPGS